MVAIMGPTDGKTTLLGLLADKIQPTGHSGHSAAELMHQRHSEKLGRHIVVRVVQHDCLFPVLTYQVRGGACVSCINVLGCRRFLARPSPVPSSFYPCAQASPGPRLYSCTFAAYFAETPNHFVIPPLRASSNDRCPLLECTTWVRC